MCVVYRDGMDLPGLIDSLAARPGPVLTWYGESRTELGGPVAARWLAKTANLLAGDLAGDLFGDGADFDEARAGADDDGFSDPDGEKGPSPTGTIRVDLGSSWQGVVWICAAWLSGWRSVEAGAAGIDEGDVDVWVTDRIGPEHPAAASEGCWVLAQASTPLALSWPGPLPDGVLDALTELSAQSDALEIVPEVSTDLVVAKLDPDSGGTGLVRVSDLGQDDRRAGAEATLTADADAGDRASSRVLLTSMGPQEDARRVLTHWAAGRSVVVVDDHDDTNLDSVSNAEHATRI